MFLDNSSNQIAKVPFFFFFLFLDFIVFKNVGNDLDDLVQPYVLLLWWSILNQNLIGYGFIKSCHYDKANQNFITTKIFDMIFQV
jgi:uncharacterized membrane protein